MIFLNVSFSRICLPFSWQNSSLTQILVDSHREATFPEISSFPNHKLSSRGNLSVRYGPGLKITWVKRSLASCTSARLALGAAPRRRAESPRKRLTHSFSEKAWPAMQAPAVLIIQNVGKHYSREFRIRGIKIAPDGLVSFFKWASLTGRMKLHLENLSLFLRTFRGKTA